MKRSPSLSREVSLYIQIGSDPPGQWFAPAMHGPKHQGRFLNGTSKVLLWRKYKQIPKTNAKLYIKMVWSGLYTSFTMMRSQFRVAKVFVAWRGWVIEMFWVSFRWRVAYFSGIIQLYPKEPFYHVSSLLLAIQQLLYHCNCMSTLNMMMWIIVAKFKYINRSTTRDFNSRRFQIFWKSTMQQRLNKCMSVFFWFGMQKLYQSPYIDSLATRVGCVVYCTGYLFVIRGILTSHSLHLCCLQAFECHPTKCSAENLGSRDHNRFPHEEVCYEAIRKTPLIGVGHS